MQRDMLLEFVFVWPELFGSVWFGFAFVDFEFVLFVSVLVLGFVLFEPNRHC